MSEYTKGPWVWVEVHGAAFLIAQADYEKALLTPSCYAIADDGSAYGEYSQTIHPKSANAKLIAAAPDLLEALHALLPALMSKSAMMSKDHWTAANKANAAIAKVRGDEWEGPN